jgi:hypothetical protein
MCACSFCVRVYINLTHKLINLFLTRKSMCIAEWDDTENISVVATIRGDFQKSFGFMRNQKWCLDVEETLYDSFSCNLVKLLFI